MEKLVALCNLWTFGLGYKDDYRSELDRLFLENPEDDFLLELEGFGDDSAAALTRLSPLAEGSLNVDVFVKELLEALERVYIENRLSPLEFGERRLRMLYALPRALTQPEPLHPL
ncbi:MAG: hypothetical protein K2J77_01280, partial [Oscillospiraceae bacterium]|nr:hypothetical protein [Oscillospiraceae bacterium]